VAGACDPRRLATAAQPPAETFDVALLDLDGVVYVGPSAVPGAASHLTAARGLGMHLAYVTNNASRPPGAVAEHLRDLGVELADTDVVTSAQAAARLVAARVPAGARVLVVGGAGLVEALAEHGLEAVSSLDDAPQAVVQGFDPSVGWTMLAEATYAVTAGLPWVASNLDRTIPTARGRAPGNGMLVAAVQEATGVEPMVAGKPEPALVEESVLRTGATAPLMVGDRLDTDISGATRAGMPSLLVLTGVTTPAQLLTARGQDRPDLVGADLGALLVPHPAVEVDGLTACCAGWRAKASDGRLQLAAPEADANHHGSSAALLAALRASVAAAWASADRAAEAGGETGGEAGDKSLSVDDVADQLQAMMDAGTDEGDWHGR
jgi:glycerol 3-phosphatase-2